MGNYPSHLREGSFFFLGGEKKILLSITFRLDPLEKSLKVFKNFFIFFIIRFEALYNQLHTIVYSKKQVSYIMIYH